MIGEIVPKQAAWAEVFTDPPEATLLPEEQPYVERAVDKRRREFTTVRHCARQALAELGIGPSPLVPGKRRAPRWPDGIVGSMTHCAGYRAAVVATEEALAGIGIDAEPHDQLPAGVLETIALPSELHHLRSISTQDNQLHWDRILFSGKESVYKTWYPITGEWLGFEDAELTLDPRAGTFRARLGKSGHDRQGAPLTEFAGRWLVRDGLVITTGVHPATPGPATTH